MLVLLFLFSVLASVKTMPNFLAFNPPNISIDQISTIKEFINPRFLQVHPDAKLTTLELIRKYNYKGQLHKIITSDDYILELHRLTGRANCSDSQMQKPVVLIMHGLLCSSVVWVIAGPEKGLAYILADAGYDVWLGNTRGTFYSRKHVTLSVLDKEYWDFSWHEMGTHDLPAMIDYILETTGQKKLFYLGHSQGTTNFFVMATEVPKYQNKIQAMFAMAPIAYCSRITSPIIWIISKFINSIYMIMKLFGQYEFEPTNECMKMFEQLVCAKDAITQPFCSNVLFLIAGFDNEQFNKTLLPIILGHIPAGASTKQIMHYAQLFKSGKFRQYDYGLFGNKRKYGLFSPPIYALKKIKVPVSLHYSSNDWLANVKDVDKLYKELGNPFAKFRVPHDRFNHLDFMWANDVRSLLYDKILSLMKRFQK